MRETVSWLKGFRLHRGSDNTVNVSFVKEKEVFKVSLEPGFMLSPKEYPEVFARMLRFVHEIHLKTIRPILNCELQDIKCWVINKKLLLTIQ